MDSRLAVTSFYRPFYDIALGRIDPERAHRVALSTLRTLQRLPGGLRALGRFVPPQDPRLQCDRFGLRFANPLGVAAGLDKDGEVVAALRCLGFGHVEVGTVTPLPQSGNPRPRLWRLRKQRALINALGFPSDGAQAVLARLRALGDGHEPTAVSGGNVLGINLGKNRDTPLEQAGDDYVALIETLFEVAQYFVLNVSSPNTPGLRELQLTEQLVELLRVTAAANRRIAAQQQTSPRPLLVKLSPDLSNDQLEEIADAASASGADGLIATNTTTARDALPDRYATCPGGMSGQPLRDRSRQVIALLYRSVGARLPIIGVGGVASASDALGHIRAGASLVQLYTGFVYGGPGLPGRMLRQISADADREGWSTIDQLVGSEAHG